MQPSGPERLVQAMIVVKAAPVPSRKYGESVCVAGVETNGAGGAWCRLFPVDFRALPRRQQFRKYDIIEFMARRPRQDTRPESWCPILETIEVIDHLPRWRDRWPLLEPLLVASMCELGRLERENGTSLGLFRPAEVVDFHAEPCAVRWDDGQIAVMNQESLLPSRRTRPLEKIPFTFSYHYRCDDVHCRGHRQQLRDWEVFELYRKTVGHPETVRVQLVRERWLERVCAADRETYFFAGNMKGHPRSFILLGAFWPRPADLEPRPRDEQLVLVT